VDARNKCGHDGEARRAKILPAMLALPMIAHPVGCFDAVQSLRAQGAPPAGLSDLIGHHARLPDDL
jgi:hypothetical protein